MKPLIDRTNLQKVVVKVGLQVQLDVNIIGEPPPTVKWTLKDQVNLLFGNAVIISSAAFT